MGGDWRPRRAVSGGLALLILLSALIAARALAAAGGLDPSFSGDGKRVASFGPSSDGGSGVAIRGGKIVVAGTALAGDSNFALARFLPDGRLDATFAGDGKSVTSFGPGSEHAFGVAIQPDGRIVAVGYTVQASDYYFAVARYLPNGSPDTSFSGDGKRMINFGPGTDRGSGVAIQDDGKIVVVGDSNQPPPSGFDFALARLRPDGGLDPSFAGDGKRLTSFSPDEGDGGDAASAVAIRGDGRIVVAGRSMFGAPPLEGDLAVARYMADGGPDGSFSQDGKRAVSFGGNDFGDAIAIAGGKIVVAGGSGQGFGPRDFALLRLNSNGSLDDSFSGDGRRLTGFGVSSDDTGTGVAIQPSGLIVVGGYSNAGGSTGYDFAIARHLPNGALDESFSGDGKRVTGFANGSAEDYANDLALYDSRIVVVGTSNQGPPTGRDFAVARYLGG